MFSSHYLALSVISIKSISDIVFEKVSDLAGVAQWIERWPVGQRVTISVPTQGTCLDCGPGPQ